ncbi:TonB family protein [Sphingomonas parva]|uniref:TonB family protein n=1 Tax=Sphingomonas parva TaxID=2555898 RepID=A0A4Y8ZSI4_9SPHN|nr:TonB family protein [Sphingomonas parva]TFI58075.1 TonB family protein [Sphingomonas parva]
MSYADNNRMSSSRIAAIVVVALLHALLGYAFVTGLAFNVVKKVAQDLKTFNVEEPPPPEEEPPPPPPEQPQVETPPPPIVSPPPLVRMPTPPPPVAVVNTAPPTTVITTTATPAPPAPPAPPPPPPPPPAKKVEAARAKANLASYVSNADYPAAALRGEEEGTTGFRLEIGPNGRVTNCTVTSSSGSSSLDSTTCRLMRSRARFTPAIDSNGNPTSDSVSSRITWRLE